MSKSTHVHGESYSFDVANRREDIERAESALLDALSRHKYPDAAKFALRLALEEALVNAFKHGHKALPPMTPAKVDYLISDDHVQIDVEDKGPGFNPGDVPDPTLDENLDKPSGRGLLLMRAYMTSLEYLGPGNHLRMVFSKSANA